MAILNKITPETFDKLQGDFCDVISETTDDSIEQVAKLMVKKASIDLKFTKLYAKLCYDVFSFETNPSFIRSVVNNCKSTFDSFVTKEEFTDIEKKDFYGIVSFIFELVKIGVITPQVLVFCSKELVRNWNIVTAETLCKMYVACGEVIEKVDPSHVQATFLFLDQHKATFEKRVSFLITDTINLRKNNWRAKYVYQKFSEPEKRHNTTHQPMRDSRKPTGRGSRGNYSKNPPRGRSNKYAGKQHHSPPKQQRPQRREFQDKSALLKKTASHSEVKKLVENMFIEYLEIKSTTEIREYYLEFNTKYANYKEFVSCSPGVFIEHVIWKTPRDIDNTKALFGFMTKESILTAQEIKDELDTNFTPRVADLRLDIPRIEEFIGILTPDGDA